MGIRDRARYCNVTAEECAATYSCDGDLDGPREALLRRIELNAPMVYRVEP